MRASVKKSIALSVAAMTLSFGIFAATTPAAAHPWPHHGFHGGFFGGALGLGLLGGMVASQYGDDLCSISSHLRSLGQLYRSSRGQCVRLNRVRGPISPAERPFFRRREKMGARPS